MQLSPMTDIADYFSCCCLQRSERKYREPRSTDKTSSSLVHSLTHHYKDCYADLRPEFSCFLYMKSVIITISFQLEYYFSFFFSLLFDGSDLNHLQADGKEKWNYCFHQKILQLSGCVWHKPDGWKQRQDTLSRLDIREHKNSSWPALTWRTWG